jgi:ABC-type glycerol-3-phosphate transport system substrate-binding protein
MKFLRPFELALVIAFGGLAVLALYLLATYQPEPAAEEVLLSAPVEIWGTLPSAAFSGVLQEIQRTNPSFHLVSYRYVPPESFNVEFVNALAERRAPQLLLLSHDQLVEQRRRLQPLSYEGFPRRDFRDRYVDGAELFALSDGIYAMPIMLDPLVMYWNRDMLLNAGLLFAPTTWEGVVGEVVPTLTMRDHDRAIRRSAIALGEYTNVKHAFPVLSMLMIQGGSRLVVESERGYSVELNHSLGEGGAPLSAALGFFARFSDPNNVLYSWNRSLPLDQDAFLREDLALYFGFGSEARALEAKNPNLNFDIAEVPQGAAATMRRTYGQFYGLSLVRDGGNLGDAYTVLMMLSGEQHARSLAAAYAMAPLHRASLAAGSDDVYGRIIYQAAPSARGWLNPERATSERILAQAVADLVARRTDPPRAAADLIVRLQQVY